MPGGWIICLVTLRQSVTENSFTSRPGNVKLIGRLMSASRTVANPEFRTRSRTRDGFVTSSCWRVRTRPSAQPSPRRACLGRRLTGASMCSRQVIRRHPDTAKASHTTATAPMAATSAGTRPG